MRLLRRTLDAALLLAGLRVFHLLLVKELLDRPLRVATWLVLIFALVVAVRALARHVAPDERGWLGRRWAAMGSSELVLVATFLVLVFLFHWGYQRAAADGREYFVQIRSLVMDGDFDFANERQFGVRGTSDRYAVGGPLLWGPFFVAAHLWLAVLDLFGAEWVRTGFANPYQRAVGFGTLVYGFAGLVLVFRLASRYFSERLALGATLAMTGGSFVLWYLVRDASMVHGTSMFATMIFLYEWHEGRSDRAGRGGPGGADGPVAGAAPRVRVGAAGPDRGRAGWARLGAAAGLMTLVRWQNLLFVVVVLPEALAAYRDGLRKEGPRGLREPLVRHGLATALAVVVFLPQLWLWRVTRGGWLDDPSGSHQVMWDSPQLVDVLFSPNRGLFSWTPLVYLAILGALFFLVRQPRVGSLLLLAFAAQVYINSTVGWGGAGFGARRFTNCTLLFVLGLAALLDWLRRHPVVAPSAIVAGLLVVNLSFSAEQHGRASFHSVSLRQMLDFTFDRFGNPFLFPRNAWIAWRHGVDINAYERLGSQRFNNLLIDLGERESTAERMLMGGWSPQPVPTWRWVVGTQATILVPLKASAPYLLDFRAATMDLPDLPPQPVEVRINGEPVGRVVLGPEFQEHEIRIEDGILRSDYDRIDFVMAWTRPGSELGNPRDDRQLSARFDWIRLTRLE